MPTYLGDPLRVQGLATPSAPTVSKRGATGETTYTYAVVAVRGTATTEASDEASVTNGASSLSAVNCMVIKPPYVANAQFFDIYRTAGGSSQGKIGRIPAFNVGGVQQSVLVDRGLTGDDTDPPALDTTGMTSLEGEVFVPNLPTSDPLVAGQLWVDTANDFVLKVSQGD